MDTDQIIIDGRSKLITVGTRVHVGFPGEDNAVATVYEITDMDADYDDDAQRPVMYPPKVKYRFDDGAEDEAATAYVPVMTNPAQMYFACEDVEVVS